MSENEKKRNETPGVAELSVTMTADELQTLTINWIAETYNVRAARLVKAAKSGEDLALVVEVRREK